MCKNLIRKEDAVLHVDLTCSKCKRRFALSYLTEYNGLYYCQRCWEQLPEIVEIDRKLIIAPPK